jgi:hypothetical protein
MIDPYLRVDAQREQVQASLREEAQKRRRLAEDARRSGGVFGRAELDAADLEEKEDAIEAAILTALMSQSQSPGGSVGQQGKDEAAATGAAASTTTPRRSVRHLELPSAEEVRAALVEERKRRLLEQML